MAHQPYPRSLHSLHAFTLKTPCPLSNTSLRIKTLVNAHIFRHMSHVVRALACAKSMVIELLKKKSTTKSTATINYNFKLRRRKKVFRSIRMCCTWSSFHVIPMPDSRRVEGFEVSHAYYDSTWNTIISTEEGDEDMEPPITRYLQWLEEKDPDGLIGDDGSSEIDRLAEKFIASCHEKFRLEKQESYRRYQEMLARSM